MSILRRDIPQPRVLDLFAGAGGFSLGFHWAGYKTDVAIDFNPNAIETLIGNYSHMGTVVLNKDLYKFTPKQLNVALEKSNNNSEFDIIIGGPPCQGWSMVGRGKIRSLSETTGSPCPKTDPRNKLYKKYLDFVAHFRPKVAVMENVTGMLSHSGRNVAEAVAKNFEEIGYEVTWSKVDASDFGVPQSRHRLFFVGVRKDLNIKFEFPLVQNSRGERLFPLVTVRDAIADLPVIRHGAKEWVRPYNETKNLSAFAKRMREDADENTIFDHICRTHNDQDLEAFSLMKQGGLYRDLPKRLKRYRDDIFEDKYRKLNWSKPSGCVTAHLSKDGYTHIHPSQKRTISVREAARLQSFPDSYFIAGAMSNKFLQIGNAVAPIVAEVIANELSKQVFNKIKKTSVRVKSPLREINA